MRGGGGKGSSALTIAFHSRGADLVEFLLRNGSDIEEMGVVSIEDDLEDLERTALHPVERRRKDILQMLLDHKNRLNKNVTQFIIFTEMKNTCF